MPVGLLTPEILYSIFFRVPKSDAPEDFPWGPREFRIAYFFQYSMSVVIGETLLWWNFVYGARPVPRTRYHAWSAVEQHLSRCT
ncbi:hypothetical protein OBBRIDRAFT_791898 [Obba rivulosa]|uniref:Uncharacterized protein n=1 Tax=Obba rivulosa TaxID=1052685 RepID=A0A8E2AVH7_9APHY|nr:hypothetical protein OBBRIDRAFT_791898 [Obba rivulosa]